MNFANPYFRLGPAVKGLLLSNVFFFFLQKLLPGVLEFSLGLIPLKVWGHLAVFRLFTYPFLHGSFMHLFLNMLTLWMFGKELESAWGTKEFLKFYALCAVGAGLVNTAFEPFSTVPVIGASGAIYGVLAAFAMVYPDTVIYLYGLFPVPSRYFVALMCFFEFFASFDGLQSHVARFAHLGGMATGYIYLKSYEFRSLLNRLAHKFLDSIFVRTEERNKSSASAPAPLAKEVDRILEKVLRYGADSLTDEEKEIMRRYSSQK